MKAIIHNEEREISGEIIALHTGTGIVYFDRTKEIFPKKLFKELDNAGSIYLIDEEYCCMELVRKIYQVK